MGAWTRAGKMAAATPIERNRCVDFLRAASILAVILGHWIMAAPQVVDGTVRPGHMLDLAPWTQGLTWIFQVMPVFFLVGGYSNAVSWASAGRRGTSYAEWLAGRLQRLVGPLLVLLAAWAVLGAGAWLYGARPALVKVASQMALIPVWFLSVYVVVALLVPWTCSLWRRWGWGSVGLFTAGAVAMDWLFFVHTDLRWLTWSNYLFVWLAVHQVGHAWHAGRLPSAAWRLAAGAASAAVLVWAVRVGPWPVSMVGVPGDPVSNTQPPKVTLLLLAGMQAGLLLGLEGPIRRWLQGSRAWTATVLINGMIMTVYLWHLTVMTLVVGVAWAAGGWGLRLDPGTGAWWWARIPWIALWGLLLVPVTGVMARFERGRPPGASVPGAGRLVLGTVLLCAGLAFLALDGIGGVETTLGLRWWVLAMPFAGAALGGVQIPGRG